ncbi:MAG: D-alanyl-D-alanine carboxypeptidase family protein [Desulfurispora sp.]|uniref:D-alanyl-D-alanine carboxypeptidase family protein n=1 Tax=Desulfurispora sp. TaxID=3014275 RepID=UPI00404B1F72
MLVNILRGEWRRISGETDAGTGKKFRRHALVPVLLWGIICLFCAQPVLAQPEEPAVAAQGAILIDLATGQVLYARNAQERLYPASTTKILTAWLAIKHGRLDDRVTIEPEDVGCEGSSVGLQVGEQVRLEDLLYALMLSSDNDAAQAIARHVAGSVPDFVDMMNREAAALGAKNSHFANPNGLPDPNHYVTAADLALIARQAMQEERFRRIAGTYQYHFRRWLPEPVRGIPQEHFVNHNKLLWPGSRYFYPGATGVKTGYTSAAGNCLVAAVRRGETELLTVVLKDSAPDFYLDTIRMLNYGFSNFIRVKGLEKGQQLDEVKLPGAVEERWPVLAGDDFYYLQKKGAASRVTTRLVLEPQLRAPLAAGQTVGRVEIYLDGSKIGQVPLLVGVDVPAFWWGKRFLLAGAVLLGLLCCVVWQIRRYHRRRRWARRRAAAIRLK